MTPEELTKQRHEVLAIMQRALSLYMERDAKYRGLWSQGGAEDNAFHMRHKAMRVFRVFRTMRQSMGNWIGFTKPEKTKLVEDAYDLLNYTLFYIWCIEHDRIDALDEEELEREE